LPGEGLSYEQGVFTKTLFAFGFAKIVIDITGHDCVGTRDGVVWPPGRQHFQNDGWTVDPKGYRQQTSDGNAVEPLLAIVDSVTAVKIPDPPGAVLVSYLGMIPADDVVINLDFTIQPAANLKRA
jgi:hypothetical protein